MHNNSKLSENVFRQVRKTKEKVVSWLKKKIKDVNIFEKQNKH